jgi:hypothetical protein
MRLPSTTELRRALKVSLICVLVAGCAGMNRSCSNEVAENFGADWIVVKRDMSGHAFECWRLSNTSIANEPSSDGIHWAQGVLGHMVHISGWYDRVQVQRDDYEGAGRLIGIEASKCDSGIYPMPVAGSEDPWTQPAITVDPKVLPELPRK